MRKGERNRVVAFLLAMLMVVSTMGSSAMTAYAQGTATDVEIVTEESTTEEISTEEGVTEETSTEEGTIEETSIEEAVTEVKTTEEDIVVEEDVEASSEEELFVTEGGSVSENEPAYTGDTGDNSLYIRHYDMEEANVEYTDENLIAIATYWKNAGRTFTDITIYYPTYQESISKEVWNAFAELQIGEDNNLFLQYATYADNCVNEWVFRNISSAETDITLGVDWEGKESGEGVEISFQSTNIPAESSKVGLKMFSDNERFSEMYNALNKEGTQEVIYDAEGKEIYGHELSVDCSEYGCEISIYEVEDLEANTTYTVNQKKYTGTVSESSGGTLGLTIIEGNWETEEELVEILQANEKVGVDEITIYETVSGNSRTIPTAVVNAAMGILSDESQFPTISFNSRGYGLDVDIVEPHSPVDVEMQGANLNFSLDVSVSGEEVKIKKNAPSINAFDVRLKQNFTEEEDGVADPFTELYPVGSLEDGKKVLFVEATNTMIYYENDAVDCRISLVENAYLLENDTWYTLTEKTGSGVGEVPAGVPGTIYVDPYGYRHLTLVAGQVNKDVFAKGELEEVLSWYTEKIETGEIEPFNYISIYQDFSEKNIIYKEDFNFLRTLLVPYDSSSESIDYFFERDAQVSGNVVTDNEQWSFTSPAPATKDMDVTNVSIKIMKNGIKIYLPELTYPSDYVNYSRSIDTRLDEAKKLYASFYNQPKEFGDGFLIYEDAETMKEVYHTAGFFMEREYNGTKEGVVEISRINELGAGVYTMVKDLEDEPLYIGETRQLKTMYTPDEGSKINYQCGTNRITIDDKGVLTPVRTGAARYAISYMLDGEWTVDFWRADVFKKLLSMKFSNASMVNPLVTEMGTTENTKLDLTYYPTGTAPKADELIWSVETVSDNSVSNNSVSANCVELILDNEGNPTGELEPVEPGEAVVTVTLKDNPNVCAKATVVVNPNLDEEESESREALGDIYAITNLDKTLKDINLPEGSGYRWVDDSMTLASQDRGGVGYYPAIYKSPIDKREKDVSLTVNLVTIDICADLWGNDDYSEKDAFVLEDQEQLYINFWGRDVYEGEELLAELMEARNLRFDYVLSTNPKDIAEESDDPDYRWMFTADAAKSGKKTFTMELYAVHNETEEKVLLAKDTRAVTVTKKPVMNWGELGAERQRESGTCDIEDVDTPLGEKGEFVFTQETDTAFGLTVKSLDPKVCKIIKQYSPEEKDGATIVRVAYECLAGGRAQILVTAKDEIKSSMVYQFNVIDVMPRALESTVTIDVNHIEAEQTDSVEWLLNTGTTILGESEELLLGDNEGLFNIDNKEDDDVKLHLVNEDAEAGTIELCAELINPSIKKGKYKVEITAPVMYDEDQSADFTTTVTINITDVEPKVTLKQTKKVNLFYTDEQSYGEFTLKSSLGTIDDVQLLPPDNKNCDYTIEETEQPDTYIVKLADDAETDKNKSGVLEVSLEEYSDPVNVKFSIKTENKKPTLVLSQKTDVLYPNYTANVTSVLQFTDKATGEVIDNISAVEYKSGKDFVALEEGENAVKGNKNTYAVTADTDKITFVLEEDSRQKTTDKFSLKIKGDNWKTSIPVSYSIKVETTNPKLALSTKTINFNMNEKVYRNEVVYVDLAFKGVAAEIEDIGNVLITAYPGEAETALNKWISAEYVDGRVRVALEDIEGLSKSSYTWKFYITVYGEETSFYVWDTVTVKLTNTAPEKCISASAKGNIDVLDSTKCITYTPKLKGVQGKVVDGYLIGPDEDMFTEVFEDGVLKVYPFDGETYSTKTKYSVKPVFIVENADGEIINLEMEKIQTIKVKQGKPKLKVDKATWYRDRQSEIKIPVSAVLNGKNVPINDVELTNFTNDLNASYEDGYIVLERIGVDKINAIGKTYNLKLNVYYADGAFNEKPASTTLKLTVK